jgi:uncharacterized protein
MQANDFGKRFSYGGQLGILIAFLGIGLVLTLIPSLLLFGTKILEAGWMEKQMLLPTNAGKMQILQICSALFTFLLPALLMAVIAYKKPMHWLGYKQPFNWQQVGLVIAIMLVALPVGGALGTLNQMIPISDTWRKSFEAAEKNYGDMVMALASMKNFMGYLIGLVVFGLTAGLTEETFFRGGMQNIFTRWTGIPALAIILTAVIFSAFHFSFFGFLTRAMLGAVLGYIYYTTGSLWLSIIGHFFNNALAITAMYVWQMQNKSVQEMNDMTEKAPLYLALFGLLLIPLFKKLQQVSPPKLETQQEWTPEMDRFKK